MQPHAALNRNILIIGAGPAGIAASVQLRLCGFSPVLLDRDEPGGLIRCAHMVRNYPGFPEGIKGEELASLFKRHIETFEIDFRKMLVKEVSERDRLFVVKTDAGTVHTELLIVASGTTPVTMPPGVKLTHLQANTESSSLIARERFDGSGCALETAGSAVRPMQSRVFYDIRPLLELLRAEPKRSVLIIGGGDLAFDYALTLAESGAEPSILTRKHAVRAETHLREAVSRAEITTITEFITQSITVLKDSVQVSGTNGTITGDYILVSIGRKACVDFLSPKLRESFGEGTSPGGLLFAGDVKRGPFRQTAIACGDGVLAAMKAVMEIRGRVHARRLHRLIRP